MEPSIEHLMNEWNLPKEEVKKRLAHLQPHKHHEFKFLGDSLYHRKDVEALAPFKGMPVPEDLREKTLEEALYL